MITLETPTKARLVGYETREKELREELSYTDKKVDFEISRLQKSRRYWIEIWGADRFLARIAELKAERKKSILFKDDKGLWTYSGVAQRLATQYNDRVVRGYELPEPKLIPWAKEPKYPARPYQVEAHDKLLEAMQLGPAGVEAATGSGKSFVIRNLLKSIGLGAVVMTPSVSIAGQIYDDLVEAFGKKYVGMFGDGKKQFDRKFVVAIGDSLVRVEPETEAWEALSTKDVLIGDEAHTLPAQTLERVCVGLLADIRLRGFFSATQERNDGLGVVLDGITGPIAYKRSLCALVSDGYLARPLFRMVQVGSKAKVYSGDANTMTRKHLYYNPAVNQAAAEYAEKFVQVTNRPTLILVEEIEQFAHLLKYFKQPVKFAHGPLTKENLQYVPEQYRDDKPKDLVAAFNRGEFPILIGTSCVSTGTDIKVAEAIIYLQGGKSRIKVSQAIGRGTRGGHLGVVVNPITGKKKLDCVVIDFEVHTQEDNDDSFSVVRRHSKDRAEIYEELCGPVQYINKR